MSFFLHSPRCLIWIAQLERLRSENLRASTATLDLQLLRCLHYKKTTLHKKKEHSKQASTQQGQDSN